MQTILVAVTVIFAALSVQGGQASKSSAKPMQTAAVMCFKTGERVSGMNKICYYDCLGSAYAITIKSHELCPLSIKR
jgi:hypothetical protein